MLKVSDTLKTNLISYSINLPTKFSTRAAKEILAQNNWNKEQYIRHFKDLVKDKKTKEKKGK